MFPPFDADHQYLYETFSWSNWLAIVLDEMDAEKVDVEFYYLYFYCPEILGCHCYELLV